MKTVCLALGLLLLTACCCNAMPKGLHFNALPETCCSRFATLRFPSRLISDITKTSKDCPQPGFIVHARKGAKICYRQSFQWALDSYNKLHTKEASGHHP